MKHRPAYIPFLLAVMVLAAPVAGAEQTVVIDGQVIPDNVYGNGELPDGSLPAGELLPPDYNTLIIKSGTVGDNVYGGYVNKDDTVVQVSATGNSVTIAGGTVNDSDDDRDVYGGYAQSGGVSATATDNSVTINGGTVNSYVSGGYSRNGDLATASDNAVTINGGEVTKSVFGGNAFSRTTGSVTATGNTATVNGGKVNDNVIGGRAYAGSDTVTVTATGNKVIINGGEIGGYVAGGRVDRGNGNATGNTVTINGTPRFSAETSLYGGTVNVDEGVQPDPDSDLFTNNTLNLDSAITARSAQNFEFINFGYSGDANIGELDTTTGGSSRIGVTLDTAANNVNFFGNVSGDGSLTKEGTGKLTISGISHTYAGDTTVSAGTLVLAGTLGGGDYAGAITNNGVLVLDQAGEQTISCGISGAGSLTKDGTGRLTLSAANSFTGALAVNTGTVKLGTSATLAANSLSLGTDAVFDYSTARAYASSSPGALKSVTVSGLAARINAGAGRTADFSGGKFHFNIPQNAVADSVLLNVDGHATLAGATVSLATLDTYDGRPQINIGEKFILLDATEGVDGTPSTATVQTASGDTYAVRVDGDELQAVLARVSPTSPVYERLKAYAESRVAGLAFVSQGLDFILNRGIGSAIATTSGPGLRLGTFGGTGGGDSRYRSGSYVDVAGMSFLAGLAVGNDTALGRATAAAFFEGGWGDYDTHNSFAGFSSVAGHGGTSYHGGGVLGRYDVTRGALAGLYLDASARLGQTKTDFRTDDIQYNDWKANFDSASLYWGLHAGLGYARAITDKTTLDLSAKALWTRQKGDSMTVYRDTVYFENADSLRTRLGGRFAYAVNDRVTPYAGAYWEHEFAGRLCGAVNGERLTPPSLRGDSGMGEVGLTYRHPGERGLTVDVGVQGYAGKRAGASGSVRVGWAF